MADNREHRTNQDFYDKLKEIFLYRMGSCVPPDLFYGDYKTIELHIDLVDSNGRYRGWIVARDNDVHVIRITRYYVETDYDENGNYAVVKDRQENKELFRTEYIKETCDDVYSYLSDNAREWLDEKYHEWENPIAYWDQGE